jgi:chemotaxis protein MotB
MRRSIALAVTTLALAGCVSTDTYRTKEREAARYKADWEAEQARTAEIRTQFGALRAEVDEMQAEATALQAKAKADEDRLVAKQAELNTLKEEAARQQALVDELSKSKKKLEVAKAELEKKSAEYQQLALSLQTEIESGRIELTELKGKLTVKMKDKILFASGSATVGKDGLAALGKVAEALRNLRGKVVRVEGHTDNVPVGTSQWGSNWELSAARALAVVRVLQDKGVDPTKLAAAGYGEFQPIADNATAEGKSLNRRIEIVLAAGS